MELNEVMEDLSSREVIIRERPLHGVHNFLAFIQKGLPHFHQLGPLDDGLSVIHPARIVSQLEGIHLPSMELGSSIDAKFTSFTSSSFLGRKTIQTRLFLKDRVICSKASIWINGLISREKVAAVLIFR